MSNWSIFPSGNSHAAQACADAWRAAGWKVAVLVDADQPDVTCDLLVREETFAGIPVAFNKMMAMLGKWRMCACINDDMFPLDCTTAAAGVEMQIAFGGLDGVLQPTGCWMEPMKWCAPSPIVGRIYADRMNGKVWHEGFYHFYCDQLLREEAIAAERFRDVPTLAIEHRHKSLGYIDLLPPEKRLENNRRHAADRALYEQITGRKAEH